jgi:hypothetical protein
MTTEFKSELTDLLAALEDYMDDRSDVLDGGYSKDGTWSNIPNEEMRLLVDIRAAAEKLKKL